MKNLKILLLIYFTSLTFLFSGCGKTLKSEYLPSQVLQNATKLNLSVALIETKDKREYEEDMFYLDPEDLKDGRFDRTISNIVRDAITQELKCVGIKVSESADENRNPDLLLMCDIINFEIFCTTQGSEGIVKATVTIEFKWMEPGSLALVNVSRQSELDAITRSRSNTKNYGDRFNIIDGEDNKNMTLMGKKLVAELLPKVIEKELTTNSFLQKRVGVLQRNPQN